MSTWTTREAYVERLAADVFAKHPGQSVLIVSHSNTVPAIVERFSGKPVAKIRDDAYGDLFIITIGANREKNNQSSISSSSVEVYYRRR